MGRRKAPRPASFRVLAHCVPALRAIPATPAAPHFFASVAALALDFAPLKPVPPSAPFLSSSDPRTWTKPESSSSELLLPLSELLSGPAAASWRKDARRRIA